VIDLFDPIVQHIFSRCMTSSYIALDATSIPILDVDHPLGIRHGALWLLQGAHCYSYFIAASSGHAYHLEDKLQGYQLASAMCDGSPTNNCVERAGAQRGGCHAHARRGLVEALRANDSRALEGLKLYAELFRIESEAKQARLTLEQRFERRQRESSTRPRTARGSRCRHDACARGQARHGSSTVTSECFVHIALPGDPDFVTAGRFRVDTDRHGVATGRFVYGKSYLARDNAVPVDPIELKLATTTYETRLLKGIFGALRDASPDYWGRCVIDKHAGNAQLGEIDYLLRSPDDRAGALGFGLGLEPPAPRREFNRTLDLEKLQDFADRIIADDDLPHDLDAQQAQELLLEGTSMGGARPKAVVEDNGALWIAKFNRADDKWNHARVERAMLELAGACGIRTAETKLTTIGDRDALLVKRFDRESTKKGYRRARMLSALTLLRAEDMHTDRSKWSYVLLAEELRRISARPKDDAPELFKRMCFNALISNSDDHPCCNRARSSTSSAHQAWSGESQVESN
jgi:serine/threonine-protein kinase HipA